MAKNIVTENTVSIDSVAVLNVPRPDALSFVKMRKPRGGGFDYWTVDASGDYGADCERGRALGAEYLAFIGKYPTYGNATLLTCIVNDMMARRVAAGAVKMSGVELAFLNRVNTSAMAFETMLGKAAAAA